MPVLDIRLVIVFRWILGCAAFASFSFWAKVPGMVADQADSTTQTCRPRTTHGAAGHTGLKARYGVR